MELNSFVKTGLGRYVQLSAIPENQHQYVYDELCALALNILFKLGNDPTRNPTDMGELLSWILKDIPAHVAFILAADSDEERFLELYEDLQPKDQDN
jgi:hypothetical protein